MESASDTSAPDVALPQRAGTSQPQHDEAGQRPEGVDPLPSFEPERGDPPFVQAPFGRPWEHWLVLGAGLGGITVLAVLGTVVDPDPRGFGTHERFGLPPCKPMVWWNVPCPGCGVTTSLALAARGRFWESIQNQPFGFVVALALPLFAAWCVWHALRGSELNNALHSIRVGRWGIWLGALMFAAWAYKLALVNGWFG